LGNNGRLFPFLLCQLNSQFCICLFVSDVEEKKHWYTHTQFAAYWRKLTEINPMVTAIAFNGGGIYSFILFARLRADNRARSAAEKGKKKV
jgi:hypothetical protein